MQTLETTTLSSRGQIVIPKDVRDFLHLTEGMQFLVLTEGDSVVLRPLGAVDAKAFAALLQKTHGAAGRAGVRKRDAAGAIKAVRATARKRS